MKWAGEASDGGGYGLSESEETRDRPRCLGSDSRATNCRQQPPPTLHRRNTLATVFSIIRKVEVDVAVNAHCWHSKTLAFVPTSPTQGEARRSSNWVGWLW